MTTTPFESILTAVHGDGALKTGVITPPSDIESENPPFEDPIVSN